MQNGGHIVLASIFEIQPTEDGYNWRRSLSIWVAHMKVWRHRRTVMCRFHAIWWYVGLDSVLNPPWIGVRSADICPIHNRCENDKPCTNGGRIKTDTSPNAPDKNDAKPMYTPVTPLKPTRNRHQTDKNHQIRGEIDLQSVLIRFCRFDVGLCSDRQICRGEIFQTCLKDLSPTNCRLSVGVVSVLSRDVRGRVGLDSATDGRWFVGLIRLCIGHMSADLTDSRPIPDRIKSNITPNCVQTECKPITVCGVIPAYKNTQNFPKISLHQSSAIKWYF